MDYGEAEMDSDSSKEPDNYINLMNNLIRRTK
jgi:hypothetical protein